MKMGAETFRHLDCLSPEGRLSSDRIVKFGKLEEELSSSRQLFKNALRISHRDKGILPFAWVHSNNEIKCSNFTKQFCLSFLTGA